MLQINLSKAEIQQLNYERFYYPCPIVQKRFHAVYMKATVKASNTTIGLLTGLNRQSVSHWIQVYQTEGIDALYQFDYGTNKSELENYSASILKSFTDHPPMSACEAKSRIEKLTGISRSPSQVRTFMKKHGLHYIKTGHIPAKADVEKQRQWVKSTLGPAIEEAQKGECHLLFMDAAHFILQPFICALWCVTRLFIKAASGRKPLQSHFVTPFGRELRFAPVQRIPYGKPPCDLLTVRDVTPARKGLPPSGKIPPVVCVSIKFVYLTFISSLRRVCTICSCRAHTSCIKHWGLGCYANVSTPHRRLYRRIVTKPEIPDVSYT